MSITYSIWYYPLACSILLGLHLGTYKAMPIFFVASIERYIVSRKQASFPYVLRIVIDSISGPFAGFLGCRFDIIHIMMTGCILCAISVGACFFAESIHTVTVLWGIAYGIGTAMTRHLQPEFLSRHFKQNLAQVNGIAFMGISISNVLLPVLLEVLLSNYGLSGTFLIYSAISLNSVPACMLMLRKRPPVQVASEFKDINEEDILLVRSVSKNVCKHTIIHENVNKLKDNLIEPRAKLEHAHVPVLVCDGTKDSVNGTESKMSVGSKHENADREDRYSPGNDLEFVNNEKSSPTEISDAFIEETKEESFQLSTTNASKITNTWKPFLIFLDPLFQLIALSQSIYFYGLSIFMIIITDYTKDVGMDEIKSMYVLISFGVGDMVSRLGLAWVTDKGYMTVTNFSALCYFFYGISVSAMTFTDDFYTIAILSFSSGVMYGSQMIVQPSIIVEFFDGQKKIMAMASRRVYVAPLTLTIPFFIGFFRENRGSYVWLMHFCNFLCIACGIISVLLPRIYRYSCRIKLSI